jgi:site-specific DNA recombinase
MRAAIYARISKDSEGTELGVKRQEADCIQEALRRNWQVVETYIDNDVSATKLRVRPEYRRMLQDASDGHIDAIIVWSIDRLTRTPRELEDIIDLADQRGLALANVGGNTDLSTAEGRVFARSLGNFARYEAENMAKRLRRKFQEKAEKGEPHGRSPYGFVRESGRDILDPVKAAVVQEVAHRVLARESLRSVATDLNHRGIHGPEALNWNSTVLRQILLRPANAGLRQHQGRVIGASTGESIYDENIHNQLVALLKDPSRRSNYVGPAYKFLLSGLAICGRCGGTMRRQVGKTVVSAKTGLSKRQPASYACSLCFKVRRKQTAVDDLVQRVVVLRMSQPDASAIFAHQDSGAALEAEARIASINAKLDTVADQFAEDSITAEQLKRITGRLRKERETANARLRVVSPKTALAKLAGDDVEAKWSVLPVSAQREVVEALMKVTISPSGSGRRFDPRDIQIDWLE